jgi:hypothetical protein
MISYLNYGMSYKNFYDIHDFVGFNTIYPCEGLEQYNILDIILESSQ